MKRTLSAVLFAGLLSSGIAWGAFTGITPRVYYYSNRQVQELWWDGTANLWHAQAIGQEAKAPQISDPLAFLTGFAVGLTLDPRVYYVTVNAQQGRLDVEELAWNRDANNWSPRNLTQQLNAPGVNLQDRGLAGFGTGINLDPRVYYVDGRNHAEELAWYGNNWHICDISLEVGAQFSDCPAAFGVGSNLDPRVYCLDANRHVRELAYVSNTWHLRDLSQELNAPALAGNVVAFGVGTSLDPRVYYITPNKHFQELAWFGGAWHSQDLSQQLNVPTSSGTDLLVGFSAGTSLDPRLYYVNGAQQIDELAWFSTDRSWHFNSASPQGAVPPGSFGAGTAVGTGLDPRLYYFGPNKQVREAAGNSRDATSWTGRFVGEEGNATPVDSIGRLIAFGVGGPAAGLDGNNFQTIVNQNPPGTTFIISSGEHRMQQIIPKPGDVFIGERDSQGNLLTTLNGSMLMTSWTKQGNRWVQQVKMKPGYQYFGRTNGNSNGCLDTNVCEYPEVLFRNDQLMDRVSDLSQLKNSGQYFIQYDCQFDANGYCPIGDTRISNQTVYVLLNANDNPNCFPASGNPPCPKLELAVTPFAFGVDLEQVPESMRDSLPAAPGVTVKDLIVEKYATPGQFGAIGNHYPGLDWQVQGNEVRLNHGVGIKFHGQNAVIRDNYMHDNGQEGIAGGSTNASGAIELAGIVENNEIANNNLPQIGFDTGFEAGGGKFVGSDGLVVRGNYVHDNLGPGLWNDLSNINVSYYGNRFIHNRDTQPNNDGFGLFHEISFAADIHDNVFDNNEGVAIRVDNSKDVNVHDNSVTVRTAGTPAGIVVFEKSRCFHLGAGDPCQPGSDGTWLDANNGSHGYDDDFQWCASNNRIHDNTVTFTGAALPAQMGAIRDTNQPDQPLRNCIKDPRLINRTSLPSASTTDASLPSIDLWHRVSFSADIYHDYVNATGKRWAWENTDNTFCQFQLEFGQETAGKLYTGNSAPVLVRCQ